MSAREIERIVAQYEHTQTAARSLAITQGFGPLSWPAANPFLQFHRSPTDGDPALDATEEDYERARTVAYDYEHANRLKRSGDGLNVIRFGTAHELSKPKMKRDLAPEMMRVIYGHLMFSKHLDDGLIDDILEGWSCVDEFNYAEYKKRVMDYERNAQRKTCDTLLQGMKSLVAGSGGPEAWRRASQKDTGNLLRTIFDEFPLVI
nr:hypothetical protein B0A51_05974 [Rachicladosporium sp. CCFEE 5018]